MLPACSLFHPNQVHADGRFLAIASGSDKLVQNPSLLLPASGSISSADGVGEFSPRSVRHFGVRMRLPGGGRDMATRAVAGNISGEATTPAGNILVEAMRGRALVLLNVGPAVRPDCSLEQQRGRSFGSGTAGSMIVTRCSCSSATLPAARCGLTQ